MNTIGQQLRALRQARNLTQQDLSTLTGVSQPAISRAEASQGIDSKVVTVLRQYLDGAPPASPVPTESVGQDPLCPPIRTLWTLEPPAIALEVRRNQARRSFGTWADHLFAGLSARSTTILASLDMDSSWEYVLVARLLRSGWKFTRASPLRLGCRLLIRDRQRNIYVGDVRRWVLYRRTDESCMVLIPQVTLPGNPPRRPDFLGVVLRDSCRAEFITEVDGPDHEQRQSEDLDRTLILDVPTLRVTGDDLTGADLVKKFEAFALPLCKNRPKSRERWR